MAWTTYQIALAIVMVITGSLNTLSTKWADRQLAVGSDGKERKFDHPFLQAVGMFIGEFTCLIAYFVIKMCCRQQQVVDGEQPRSFNPLIFLPAALLDMCGTSIMYIGLNLTYASSFQMLRGAVIIFTALLSVAFLGRVIKKHMWVGMFTVLLGLLLVGLADIVFGSHDDTTTNTNGIIAGDLLIIMAQVIVSVQMVYEERVIGRYNVQPLAAVGSEGLFGALVLGILLIPFYYIHAGSFSNTAGNRLENAEDAFVQMGNNWKIILATVGNIMSIAFFNFAGISVTRELSATTRMVLDSVRTLVIWAVTLLLSWQDFQYLQVVGFVLLVIGMALYNDIIIMPWWRRRKERREMREIERHDGDDDERRRLLENDGAGHVVN
ncbi:solute carrier family 35 member F6-like isoform X2 [Mercenaria mercenaria]|uniref:solute carrier family 35 member F6-like isoform X2 n=1 Tax=Mercenaria mercenaria TaxID=6596 RepID=UPI00234EB449|nr:solute carrier family 35 member F6-like isoform X2 [Mercenaria mercenaria]